MHVMMPPEFELYHDLCRACSPNTTTSTPRPSTRRCTTCPPRERSPLRRVAPGTMCPLDSRPGPWPAGRTMRTRSWRRTRDRAGSHPERLSPGVLRGTMPRSGDDSCSDVPSETVGAPLCRGSTPGRKARARSRCSLERPLPALCLDQDRRRGHPQGSTNFRTATPAVLVAPVGCALRSRPHLPGGAGMTALVRASLATLASAVLFGTAACGDGSDKKTSPAAADTGASEGLLSNRAVDLFAMLPEGVRHPEGITANPVNGDVYVTTFVPPSPKLPDP